MSTQKGIYLALLTALISGVSVFLNGFVVKGFDPFVFTTLKNISVVLFLSSIFFIFSKTISLNLSRVQWTKLIMIGALGGSIPFLLFFWGLSLSSGAVGSFVYRLLFLFGSIIAFVFLKEKLDKTFIVGGLLILAGNILLLKGVISFGLPEMLILAATVLWAVEFNLSKIALKDIDPKTVAWGRMFFGSIILIGFLAFTGKAGSILELNPIHWEWVIVTGAFLFGYLLSWYPALSELPVSVATPVLALGGPVSAFLSIVFQGKFLTSLEAMGMLLTIIGIAVIANLYGAFKSHLNSHVVRA